MGKPIYYAPPSFDPRAELIERLQSAPQEHAEALLDAYDILRLLHEKGILELVKGALGSGEKVLQVLTETLEMKETVQTLRNFIVFARIVGGLDPRLLQAIQSALNENIQKAQHREPPGLVQLGRRMSARDSRRALGALAGLLEAIGQNLLTAEVPEDRTKKRKPTKRHQA